MKPPAIETLDLVFEDSGEELPPASVVSPLVPEEREERVETALVDRPRARSTIAQPTVGDLVNALELATIRGYVLIRELMNAPGAWIFEARDGSGGLVLVQIARCRRIHSEVERVQRVYFEKRVAEQTSALLNDGDIKVVAHGGADQADGSRVLFWVMPWREDATSVGRAQEGITSAEHLVDVALSLARRLVRRHAIGRADVILSEHLLILHANGLGADLLGVPLFLPSTWLESEMISPRLAPEEFLTGSPRELGDIWRLGQTMLALAHGLEELPRELAICLEDLTNPDPLRRIPRATEALVELEAVKAHLEGSSKVFVPLPIGSATVSLHALTPEAVAALLLASSGDSTKFEPALPAGMIENEETEADPRQTETPHDTEDVAKTSEPAEPKLELRDETRVEQPRVLQDNLQDELAGEIISDTALAETLLRVHTYDVPETSVFEVPNTVATVMIRPKAIEMAIDDENTEVPPPRAAEDGEPEPETPPLREDASTVRQDTDPWRDAPRPTGREPRAQSRAEPPKVAAFTEPIKIALDDAPSDTEDLGSGRAIDDELRAMLQGSLPVSSPQLIVMLLLASLTLLGAILLVARLWWPSADEKAIATPANEVVLESNVPGALVYSETDGRALGSVPLNFLVPPGADARVILAAEGHDPISMTLPDRGRFTASLPLLSATQATCSLAIEAPRGSGIEKLAGDARLEDSGRWTLKGPAVFRAKIGQDAQGTWIVRCPPGAQTGRRLLERREDRELREIAVTKPAGVPAFIDGEAAGTVPVRRTLTASFVLVRLEDDASSVERWVPVVSELEIEMPPPP